MSLNGVNPSGIPVAILREGVSNVRSITGFLLEGKNKAGVSLAKISCENRPHESKDALRHLEQQACKELLGNKANFVLADKTVHGAQLRGYAVNLFVLDKEIGNPQDPLFAKALKEFKNATGAYERNGTNGYESTCDVTRTFANKADRKIADAIDKVVRQHSGVFDTAMGLMHDMYLHDGLPKAQERRLSPDFNLSRESAINISICGNATEVANSYLQSQLKHHANEGDGANLTRFVKTMLSQLDLGRDPVVDHSKAPKEPAAGGRGDGGGIGPLLRDMSVTGGTASIGNITVKSDSSSEVARVLDKALDILREENRSLSLQNELLRAHNPIQSNVSTGTQTDDVVNPNDNVSTGTQTDDVVNPNDNVSTGTQTDDVVNPNDNVSTGTQTDDVVNPNDNVSTGTQTDDVVNPNDNVSTGTQTDDVVNPNDNVSTGTQTDDVVNPNDNVSTGTQTDDVVNPNDNVSTGTQTDDVVNPNDNVSTGTQTDDVVNPNDNVSTGTQTDDVVSPNDNVSTGTQTDESKNGPGVLHDTIDGEHNRRLDEEGSASEASLGGGKINTLELNPQLMPIEALRYFNIKTDGTPDPRTQAFFDQIASGIQSNKPDALALREYIKQRHDPSKARADVVDEANIHRIYADAKKESPAFALRLEMLFSQFNERRVDIPNRNNARTDTLTLELTPQLMPKEAPRFFERDHRSSPTTYGKDGWAEGFFKDMASGIQSRSPDALILRGYIKEGRDPSKALANATDRNEVEVHRIYARAKEESPAFAVRLERLFSQFNERNVAPITASPSTTDFPRLSAGSATYLTGNPKRGE
ncbi:hypothetical protein [Pseudomonas chlororaphis]